MLKRHLKQLLNIGMGVLLLFLMAYQVTGEMAHEWLGLGMVVLVVLHQVLNRRWYPSLWKGPYTLGRAVANGTNVLLLSSFALTAFCGMAMSVYAVPFLHGMARASLVRGTHLSLSHWTFVLMGFHLGLHLPVLLGNWKLTGKLKTVCLAIWVTLAGVGLFLFLKHGIVQYLLFRVPFAFLDYEKAAGLVLLENLLMSLLWVFIGGECTVFCRGTGKGLAKGLRSLLRIGCAIALGLVLAFASHGGNSADTMETDFMEIDTAEMDTTETDVTADTTATDTTSSDAPVEEHATAPESSLESAAPSSPNPQENTLMNPELEKPVSEVSNAAKASDPRSSEAVPAEISDHFVLIPSGTFLMGSPKTENWRLDDELQHSVTVSAFYMDPYETTQKDYKRLMGENPSSFQGKDLPVESISWLEAVKFANAKSREAGLPPAYTLTDTGVVWNQQATGYRLPTEAEWEYACRAGTTTPFSAKHSLDASEANFYGHYPYEIEENYFDDSVLEAKPGVYRGSTLPVGSFNPNAWGLYDCHGNVNEWCWDYYGEYDPQAKTDPTGAENQTRHVYRGGGWNDFGKNMRCAYRAAGQTDLKSPNLGVRLVRNADASRTGTVTAAEKMPESKRSGKVLIAYFSWGGNTRNIAREIQRQTGADLFEIAPVKPYSDDYNTVLMQSQEDQHRQARPKLTKRVKNMRDYDVILLGYPNWWASIPMPVAAFLEEYDFSGKRILPFCSHGGGRFGQSLTAIAKLAPQANLRPGLSVHYSGGSSLPQEISAWLEANQVARKKTSASHSRQ